MKKAIDTGSIDIEKVIVHSIPKHKKKDYSITPTYSEQESLLPDGLRVFFKDKIIQSLNSKKELKVCYDMSSESIVPKYIKEIILDKDESFVDISKNIARCLYEIQEGQNSSGILVIMNGKVSNENFCIIIKLEQDSGAQLELDAETKSYNIIDVQNLMLTAKTKIYKVGLFINKDNFKVGYDGIVADHQISHKNKKDVTTWFIERFLGCSPLEDPRITTKKFYDLSTTYIQSIENQGNKVKYTQDLNSYLQMNSKIASASEFAEHYLDNKDKQKYYDYLKDEKFDLNNFPKNISYIESKIKKITLSFDNDISIIGKKGTFEENVKLKALPDGNTKVEMTSKVRSIK